MILFKQASDISDYIAQQQLIGKKIGLVPTMGALHQGHMALIEACREQSDITACTIFVNPTQFNDPKDFQKYPITIEKDIYLLEKKGTDIIFLPPVEQIYPQGTNNIEQYELGYLETILEGKYRPGHFQGVCQVMHRILDIVKPQHLFMGQKDFQQCMVVKRLLQLMKSTIIFHSCPTVREADGLAMSSRNMRLKPEERKKATAIYEALTTIKKNLKPGDLQKLIATAKDILIANDFTIDYVEIADANTLELTQSWDGKQQQVALIAAFQHEVRLIDNMILTD